MRTLLTYLSLIVKIAIDRQASTGLCTKLPEINIQTASQAYSTDSTGKTVIGAPLACVGAVLREESVRTANVAKVVQQKVSS